MEEEGEKGGEFFFFCFNVVEQLQLILQSCQP